MSDRVETTETLERFFRIAAYQTGLGYASGALRGRCIAITAPRMLR
jgi:hypothetical protein